jgi:hypothetical protein
MTASGAGETGGDDPVRVRLATRDRHALDGTANRTSVLALYSSSVSSRWGCPQ